MLRPTYNIIYHHLIPFSTAPAPISRNACFKGYDSQTVSPKTKSLNPSTPFGPNHKIVGVQKCEQTNCTNNICPKPCDPAAKVDICAHLSSKPYIPPEETREKEVKKVASVNYNGENKDQFAFTYKEPYEASPNELREDKNLSAYLNKNLKDPKDVYDPKD